MKLGGIGSLQQILPISPYFYSIFSSLKILTMKPGAGYVALPGFDINLVKF